MIGSGRSRRGALFLGLALANGATAVSGQGPADPKKPVEPTKAKSKAEVAASVPWGNIFDKNVKVTVKDDVLVVESDGIPTHPTGTFPNSTNPNRITKQDYRFQIPRTPKVADRPTPTPMGPIGVALNGIPFYNQYNAQRRDAVSGMYAEVFDSCCGHPDPMGRYHYHKYPACVKSPFRDPEGEHSPLIGLMFDGFALYGPNGDDGRPAEGLDESNGHEDKSRGYHYHVTAAFPYLIGSYRGVVDRANLDGPGGPGGMRPPLLAALDLDNDRGLSADEIKKSSDSLQALDKDRDGRLSTDEIMATAQGPGPGGMNGPGRRPVRSPGGPGFGPPPGGPGGPGGGPPLGPFVRLLDADGDRAISAEEIQGAPTALKALDKDGDGKVDREEMPRPPGGPPGPGGPDGPSGGGPRRGGPPEG